MDLETHKSRQPFNGGSASTLSENLDTAKTGPPGGYSRLGAVIALVGLGLLMVGVSDADGRTGHPSSVVPLFLVGLACIFGACAWRLTSRAATRSERVWVSVVLGVGLQVSYTLRSPLIFDNFDELAHSATLMRLLESRSLFPNNPILPVSTYFPGIELVTIATKWLTGLPVLISEMIVLLGARVVLVLCVFLIVERACGSAKAGGVGVLVYAAGPEFYSLGAQYGYQTLALTFSVAVVYLLFVSVDSAHPRMGRIFALAIAAIAAMAISHHVTAWLTVAFLVVWAGGLRFVKVSPRRSSIDSGTTAAMNRRREQARIVGVAALAGVVLVAAWTAFVGHVLTSYVGPLVQEGADSAAQIVGQFHGNRQLFQNEAGGGTPGWESALILAAAVSFCLILVASLYALIWKKSVRGGRLRYLPAVVAAAYPLALLTNISTDAKLVGARSTTFIFFGMALVVGGWLAGSALGGRNLVVRVATIVVAVICFLGSTLYGGGPLPGLVNGTYIVGAHERSLGAPSFALANWVSTHLPYGSRVAVDRDNGALLNDIGRVDPVSPLNGANNPAPLFFDRQITLADIALLRRSDIRYVVTDTRLTEGLPLYGADIAPGETSRPTRLTMQELQKFNSIPGVYRIYDNGTIQVYDVSRLAGVEPLQTLRNSVGEPTSGTNVPVLLLACLVAIVWLLRLFRRRRHAPINEHLVVCGLTGAMVIGLFGAFAVRLFHLPPTPVSVGTLLLLLVVGLWPTSWKVPRVPSSVISTGEASRDAATAPAASTTGGTGMTGDARAFEGMTTRLVRQRRWAQLVLGCIGLVLFVAGATVATVAARRDQVPPPELSVSIGQPGGAVAQVDLGTSSPSSARLELTTGDHVVWSTPLASTSKAQAIALPPNADQAGSSVQLVTDGETTRSVEVPSDA